MAWGFDATADRAYSTTHLLDFTTNYSVCFHAYATDLTGVKTLFSINNGTQYDYFAFINGVAYIETEGSNGSGTTVIDPDTYYFVTLVRNGLSLEIYLNSVLEKNLGVGDPSGRAAPERTEFGGFGGGSNTWRGRIGVARAYTAVLTTGEMAVEQASPGAVRTSDLWADWRTPLDANRFVDSSGNGRDLTEGGAITDEPNPFGGTTVELAAVLSGTGDLSGALAVTKPLAAALSGAGALSSTLGVTKPLGAALSGTGALAAGLALTKPLAVTLSGTGNLSATLAGSSGVFVQADVSIVSRPRNRIVVSRPRDSVVDSPARNHTIVSTPQ